MTALPFCKNSILCLFFGTSQPSGFIYRRRLLHLVPKEQKKNSREASLGLTPRGKVSFRDAASPQLVGHQGQSARGSVHGGGHLSAPSRHREGSWDGSGGVATEWRCHGESIPSLPPGAVKWKGARPFSWSAHVCGGSNLE